MSDLPDSERTVTDEDIRDIVSAVSDSWTYDLNRLRKLKSEENNELFKDFH